MTELHPTVTAHLSNWRLTPATLYNHLDKFWVPASFLQKVAITILRTIFRKRGRLTISWPPRNGKSTLGTIATTIWILENLNRHKVIIGAYGDKLAIEFGSKIRDTIRNNSHILNTKIKSNMKGSQHFGTTNDCEVLCSGIGGPITGFGADTFIIDDYCKSFEEAYSETLRNKVWDWFTGTAYHRLEPGGSMIIIATRWHEDDLIGRVMKHDTKEEWEHIKFPAIAEQDDPLGRLPGEALFPEYCPIEELLDRQNNLTDTQFRAVYQQNPEPDASNALTDRNWIHYFGPGQPEWDALNNSNLQFARVWDFGGHKKEADPTAGVLVAGNPATHEFYVLDIWRGRVSPRVLRGIVRETAMSDGTATKVIIEQEPGQSGEQIVQFYRDSILNGFKVEGVRSTRSKVERAVPFLAAVQGGEVKFLKSKWNKEFEIEFDEFPNSLHDDQIDACSIGYNHIIGKRSSVQNWQATGRPFYTDPAPTKKPVFVVSQ